MFKIYNASAGSGKTTNLVIEYLTLCFKDLRKYKNILAITFTNNATAEMKSRIIQTLETFAFSDYATLNSSQKVIFNKVAEHLHLSPIEMKEKSIKLLQNILYDYADFSISTIDSFFQRIIRAFALDIGINLNYNLEIQLDDFYTQTIDILLNRISKDNPDLSKRVLAIVENKMDEKGSWNIERDLLNFMPVIYNEKSYIPLKAFEKMSPEELQTNCQKLLENHRLLKHEIKKLAATGEDYIKESGLSENDFIGKSTGMYTWFTRFSQNIDKFPLCKYFDLAIEQGSFAKNPERLPADLNDKILRLYEELRDKHKMHATYGIITKNLTSLMIMVDLKLIMDEIKERDNLFYLQEANFEIYDKIKDEDAPYIYEKLGNKYGYFFIDEFQDTSEMQWANMLPLIKNALSQSYSPYENETGEVILFGDIKQAIYRFRNGDSSLLYNLSKEEGYQNSINPLDEDAKNFQLCNLTHNYRSAKSIIEFNNLFFKFLAGEEKIGLTFLYEYYQDVEQIIPESNDVTGFVSIQFDPKTEENYFDTQTLLAIEDAQNRGYQLSDIAILSTNNKMGTHLGRLLNEHNIPVISSESLLISSSDKISAMVAMLKFVLNEKDSISKLLIYKYLQDINQQEGINIEEINDNNLFTEFLNRHDIHPERKRLNRLPIYTLVKEICKIFSFDATDAYIAAFLDIVFQYEGKKGKELIQFLDWWEEQQGKLSLSSSEGINAVTISTIHKAKGLEYPIVIFPITQYKTTSNNPVIWHQNLEENSLLPYYLLKITSAASNSNFSEYYNWEKASSDLDIVNLLYVVHTRAKHGLYIITKNFNEGNYSKELNLFIKNNIDKFSPDDEYRYWFGDYDFSIQPKKEDLHTSIVPSLKQLYFSDFTPDFLVSSSKDFETPEQKAGIAVHNFLSSLKEFPQTLAEIDAMEISTESDYSETIKNALRRIMSDNELRPYFAKGLKVLNEVTIATAEGSLRRPDRIVFLPEEVMVIDYKTGREKEEYTKQIDIYCSLLKEMGYSNVSGKIIYL